MFYNFNTHRQKKSPVSSSPSSAKKIFNSLIKLQRRWADYMGEQTAKCNLGALKALFITVLIFCAAYSGYLVYQGIFFTPLSLTSGTYWQFDPEIVKQPYDHREFEMYLDSLDQEVIQDSLNGINQNTK